jgi:hypothetical protein
LLIAALVLEMNKVRKATRVVAIHWNWYNSIRVTSMVHQISPIRIHNNGLASCNDKRKNLTRVKATFIRRTSLKNPTPWLPAARTHEKMKMFSSRPW